MKTWKHRDKISEDPEFWEALFDPESDALHVAQIEPVEIDEMQRNLSEQQGNAVIVKIQGAESQTKVGFFNAVATALKFPNYFGGNWNSFDECITDLRWNEGNAYLLIVDRAELLLGEEDSRSFEIFLSIAIAACEEWKERRSETAAGEEQPIPFHVLLAYSKAAETAFAQKLTQAMNRIKRSSSASIANSAH